MGRIKTKLRKGQEVFDLIERVRKEDKKIELEKEKAKPSILSDAEFTANLNNTKPGYHAFQKNISRANQVYNQGAEQDEEVIESIKYFRMENGLD